MFRKSYFFLIIALILTAILIVYQQLGGFKEPEISFVDLHEYRIAGNYYEGKITSDGWESLYFRIRDLVKSGTLPGTLTIVWYNEPEKEEGFARAFIGVQIEGNPEIPDWLEVRVLTMNGVIRATMRSHVTVMPNPQKVARMIKEWASIKQYPLQNVLIERYPGESVIYSEIPVKIRQGGSGVEE